MSKPPAKKWFKPNFDFDVEATNENNTASTKTKQNTPVEKKATKAVIAFKNLSNCNLLEKVAPVTVSDLAVHTKKVAEVENWLMHHVVSNNNVSVLLITGPTGAGKTATVNVLCKSLNIKLIEWINPSDTDSEEIRGPGQTIKWTDFLLESSRYTSLLQTTPCKKVTLVEDFPNSIIHNPTEFEDILRTYMMEGKSSLIFICTDTRDNKLNLAHHLFPQTLRDNFKIRTISFNPVSVTLLKAALKRANSIIQESYNDLHQIPSQETIETIVNSAMGDVRCAINYFNFACLKGSADLPSTFTMQPTGSKRKRKEKDKGTLSNMSRDESLGLLHGVGRVLYPKKIQLPTSWKFEHKPELIVDQFITIPMLFVSFLHENYLRYFGEFSNVADASEILSTAELFTTNWREKDDIIIYGLWIAIMGLMVKNEKSVSQWNPVRGPKHIQRLEETTFEGRRVNSMDKSYYNILSDSTLLNTPRFIQKL